MCRELKRSRAASGLPYLAPIELRALAGSKHSDDGRASGLLEYSSRVQFRVLATTLSLHTPRCLVMATCLIS